MEHLIWGTLSALWLGILTSISPCPLATNADIQEMRCSFV